MTMQWSKRTEWRGGLKPAWLLRLPAFQVLRLRGGDGRA